MPNSDKNSKRRVAIVGAGLVGSLAAIYFAQRGWEVELFERRKDIRIPVNKVQGRSINLALSTRGLSALRATGLGLDQMILSSAIPMPARMIHIGKEGRQISQNYGVHGEYINSIDRAKLNEDLLDAAEKFPNVTIFFHHLLIKCDLDTGVLEFQKGDQSEVIERHTDLIVGADGAYSFVRSQLMKRVRMDYHQDYIDSAYCELTIPPKLTVDGVADYQMNPNRLHIWPRHTYMLIALPNPDKSFTCTLFMPWSFWDKIKTEDDLMIFFRDNFNDAIPLIGEERLKQDFFSNHKGSLMSIKCAPYHYKDRALIIGDAAHAMVPFYGQGMNCGFEDVELLGTILDGLRISHDRPAPGTSSSLMLEQALERYTETRHPDAKAICDLAMHNYVEMRHSVLSPTYLLRKWIEAKLHIIFPTKVIPLYTMVSFSKIRYSEAVQRWNTQTWWLGFGGAVMTVGLFGSIGFGSLRYGKEVKLMMAEFMKKIGS